jgi:hypothetical protein
MKMYVEVALQLRGSGWEQTVNLVAWLLCPPLSIRKEVRLTLPLGSVLWGREISGVC